MNVILGNGISAFVIASCLKYRGEKFEMYCEQNVNLIPNIMLLKYDNDEELELYKSIFEIDDIEKYLTTIRVGYYYDGKIHDNISNLEKEIYLKKQNRSNTLTSMSDSKNLFKALLLNEIYRNNYTNLKYKHLSEYLENDSNIVYDTMDIDKLTNDGGSYEFITKNDYFDVGDYNYVYDCTESNIKRYTKETIEYIKEPNQECLIIKNYYNAPKIYVKNNKILLGRYATKTQMKQKDIIDYLIYGKGNIYEI